MSIKEVEAITPISSPETRPASRPARRRLSILEKTAIITSALRFFVLLTALLAFVFNKATPASDVPVVAVLSLLIIGLLATKVRWAPLVCAVLAAYILYNTFTEPFLLFDIANPKGPNGGQGFALYIADVLALGSTLIVLGCCIGASIQNYRQNSPWLRRWYSLGMCLVVGMYIGALFIGAMASPPASTGVAYTNGVPTVHMGAAGFNQPSVTIPKGSSLLLVDDSSVEHIFFNGYWQNGTPVSTQEPGAPVVSNIEVNNNSTEIGPFVTTGTYHIYCSIHQGMNLTIIVE